ncbi:MAG: hypothetical protein II942_00295 [Alphaproteobacteria bacterium]|nr:hypothetical protein [Alphaproteobacteria bacterium]
MVAMMRLIDLANGKYQHMMAEEALAKVKELKKIFSPDDDDDLSAWDASMTAEQNKKDLRDMLIDTWDHIRVSPQMHMGSSELGLARVCQGLKYVGPKAMMKMFHDEPGYGTQVNERLLKKYFIYTAALHEYEHWKEYINTKNFWGGLKSSEMIYFVKLIGKNQEEKISFLSEDERENYRKAVVDVYDHLPSDLFDGKPRFDKMPQALGLAMADPAILINSVKKYGPEKTAKGVVEWFDAERAKYKQEVRRKVGLVTGITGASVALPTAVFTPNMPMVGRGILGAVAAVSGWLALYQLRKHDENKKEHGENKLGKVAAIFDKYSPSR